MKDEYRELLKNSVEMRYRKRCLIWDTAVFAVYILIFGLLFAFRDEKDVAMGIAVTLAIFWLPVAAVDIYRILKICQAADAYTFTEAVLNQPHGCWYTRDRVCFTVCVQNSSGDWLGANTNSIFCVRFWEPRLEDYVNQKALIGYNDETGMVVVIGKV